MKKEKKTTKKIHMKPREIISDSNTSSEVSRVVIILSVVIGVFLIVYFVTAIATGEITLGSKKEESLPTEIQYQEILAGETFHKSDANYYVLFLSFTDRKLTPLLTKVDQYLSTTGGEYVYYVDLDKGFNAPFFVTEGSNPSVTKASDLKVKSPTLIRISKKKVSQYTEGYDSIMKVFDKLSK